MYIFSVTCILAVSATAGAIAGIMLQETSAREDDDQDDHQYVYSHTIISSTR